jgi:Zn-finger nucleic acid-binding protein
MRHTVNCPHCARPDGPQPFEDQNVCFTTCARCHRGYWFDVGSGKAFIERPNSDQPTQKARAAIEAALPDVPDDFLQELADCKEAYGLLFKKNATLRKRQEKIFDLVFTVEQLVSNDFSQFELEQALAAYNKAIEDGNASEQSEHWSDCATNNRGCPELLGPCDCSPGPRVKLSSATALPDVPTVPESAELLKFIGACDEQVNWGGGDDPREFLSVGSVYRLAKREVHSMHTRIHLVGLPGKWFNSVCFASAAPEPALDVKIQGTNPVGSQISGNVDDKQPAQAEQPRNEPVQQEHVGVFREDDDIGHVDLCPHQQMKLKDGDLLYAAPQAQPMSDEQSAWFIKEYSFSGTSTRAECLIRAVERFHKIGG